MGSPPAYHAFMPLKTAPQIPPDASAPDAALAGSAGTPSSLAPATAPAPAPAPYAGLTPDAVLDALAAVGLFGDGRLIQLNSYENRVYQVFLEDGRVVVAKFYRPGRWSDAQILEEHRFAAELAAEEIPIAAPWVLTAREGSEPSASTQGEPPTLATLQSASGPFRFAVAERRAGRAPELEDPATLEWLGRFIGRLHSVGARSEFQFRRKLSLAQFGWASRDWLLAHGDIPGEVLPDWSHAVDDALAAAEEAFSRAGAVATLRLHGDCHSGNVLWTTAGPHFVDLDDTVTGPAVQDLWMLLSGDPVAARQQLRSLLTGYEAFMDFDDRELALIEPLRTLRMIHYSAWLAQRWRDPAFPAAFPWFGTSAYWSQQATQLRQQLNHD